MSRVASWLKREHPDVVRILRLVKYEAEAQAAHLLGKLSPSGRRKRAELLHASGLKLHIASGGTRFPGWTNIDVNRQADVQMDLRRRLPLRTGSASLVFCEHFADHVAYPAAITRFLGECRRVLEPGGTARFVLHDAAGLMRAYTDADDRYFEVSEQAAEHRIIAVNHLFRFNDFHQFLYDYEMFSALLLAAGFREVRRCRYRESQVDGLAMDYVLPSREMMSMYVEAVA